MSKVARVGKREEMATGQGLSTYCCYFSFAYSALPVRDVRGRPSVTRHRARCRSRSRRRLRADLREAFLSLWCALICWHFPRVDWVAGRR
jgi:hypothetical protein